MADIYHKWGSDLSVGSGGDIALTSEYDLTNQRILRRLLTNPGDYIWNLGYGGGLSQFIGQPASPLDIESVIRSQLALESAVSQSPEPSLTIGVPGLANGYVVADIAYTDGVSASAIQLSVKAGT